MGKKEVRSKGLGTLVMRKIRVLFVMGGIMRRAGAETMIMQYLRQLVKDDRFEFSILVHGYEKGDYDDEIASYGVPIYHVPVRGKHPFTYSHEVKKVLIAHPVDIIHCNMDSACGYFLSIAKKCGIQHRIAHSHTTRYQAQSGIKKAIGERSKREIHTVATARLACSEKAGRWLFGKDPFEIVNNAIDLRLYLPCDDVRKKKRDELRIVENAFVIGHVGRLCYEKNHKFLLQVFAQLKKLRQNSKLILVGVGDLMEEMKEYAVELGINTDVLFLGLRSDIPELLQAMDCFVMPSLFEGLPVSGIEAQAAGLPCLFANTITREICMTSFAKLLPLDKTDEWTKELLQVPNSKNIFEAQEQLRKKGYDIVHEACKLAEHYLKYFSHSAVLGVKSYAEDTKK